MYSNENKNGFSILDIIVRIIFAGLFIFILIWLFQKKVPNMKPFYSNVFRENISYMQEAAESYFTDDKMPKEADESVKLSLSEMLDKKIVLPFVDEDGNQCNLNESYVSITKQKDESYILKTNLVCGKESDYVLKVLGCHNYCKDNECNKTCTKEQIISYQYKKQQTGKKTTYSCPSGYKLDGKYCYKTVLSDTKSAIQKISTTRVEELDAKLVQKEGSSFTKLDTIKTTNKSYKDKVAKTTKTVVTRNMDSKKNYVNAIVDTKKVYTNKITNVTPSTTKTTKEAYACQTTKTEKQCTTTYTTSTTSCNCTGSWVKGQYVSTCSTCTSSIPHETCNNVTKTENATCYRDKVETIPGTTTYSCPSGYTSEGTGSNLKCYKSETTYSCPSGYSKEGSGKDTKCYKISYEYSCPKEATSSEGTGSNLTCYKSTTTYSCPAGYLEESSASTAKCYTINYTYSCPKEANVTEGSGKYLKCYISKNGSYAYECKDSSYTLKGTKCYKNIKEESTKLACDNGYKLEGETCKKYTEEKIKATSKTSSYKYYSYKWSKETSLSGWTKTGKTKTEEGKEICK